MIKENLKYIISILAITFIAFFPSLQNDFVFWDDPEYVLNNPYIKELNIGKLFNFNTFYMGNYHPLAMISLALDYKIWEFNPFGYHLTNIIFHLLNTTLVFSFVYLLFKENKLEIATVTALLFGIHPLHVESVTWISERKDVLYTFFFLSSLVCYAIYSAKNYDKKWLFTSLALFILSCFSKGQAVVLSPILILIDLFLKRKIEVKSLVEKIPFFALSLFFGLKAIEAQKSTAAINANYEGLDTLFYGSYGIVTYIQKLFLPIDLAGAHPYPFNPVFEPMPSSFKIYPVIVLALAGLVFWLSKKNKVAWFGSLFYLVSIFIVLKFIPVGDAIIAERYTYIPYIGLFMIIGWYLAKLYNTKKQLALAVFGVITVILTVTTFQRTKVWKNTFTFWEDVQKTYPNYWRSYNCIGQEYLSSANKAKQKGDMKTATEYYQKAVEQLSLAGKKDKWCPPPPYMLRGAIYTDNLRDYEKAIADFEKVISFPNKNDPTQLDARYNLGLAYMRAGKLNKGIKVLDEAIAMNPNVPKAYYFKGLIYAKANNPKLAIENYSKAIQLNPNYAEAYLNRGVVYTDKTNEPQKGLQDFAKVLQLNPNNFDAQINSAIAYYKLGKPDKAINIYNRMLQQKPNSGRIYYLRALAYSSKKDFKAAIADAKTAQKYGMNTAPLIKQWSVKN